MKNNFKYDWLREIPDKDFNVPPEYNNLGFLNWEKNFYLDGRRIIGGEDFGKVYDVGEGLVAKVFNLTPIIKNSVTFGMDNMFRRKIPYFIEREFWMAKKLFESGINVPNPEGLFLAYDEFLNEYKPAFVMERIDDFKGECFGPKEYNHVKNLRDKEIDKADNKGFIPGIDARSFGNFLYSKEEDKVYLIDFMFWGVR